ncbi:MAG: PEP-CTERM sorting domain-containing protein [Phycisphaerales bacterium]
MKVNVLFLMMLSLVLFSTSAFAVPGDVLSYASTGETEVWGMDVFEAGGSLQIHMVAGHAGQVYKFGADSLAGITNGSQGVWDSKTAMFGTTGPFIMGLSIVSTYNGDGCKYIGYGDNVAKYTSTWGAPNPVGSLGWDQFDTPYTTYAYHTDMTPASRAGFTGDRSWDTWTVNSADFGGGAVNAIYKVPNLFWTSNIESYLVKYVMPKTLTAVALGGNNDLWVLCADKEILHVSSVDGSISDRFYLDSSIAAPFGMTYSALSDSLWVVDQANNNIYQVSVPEPATIVLTLTGFLAFIRNKKHG